jgi:sugar phosphate isomerase/epimerase
MICSFPLRPGTDLEKTIDVAEKAGYTGVEIHPYPDPKSMDALLRVKDRLKEFELVTAHYPLYSPEASLLSSPSLLKRRYAVQALAKNIKFVSQFEPRLYIVHPGRAYSPLEDFIALKDACRRQGMRLSLENGTSHPHKDLATARMTCKLLGVGMTLDVGHAFASKQDIYELSGLKDVIEHVHLHNVSDTDHQRFSGGFISMPLVVEALKRIQYDKGIVAEVHHDPDFLEALVESKKILDLLWKRL